MILLVTGTRDIKRPVTLAVLARSRAAQAATFLVVGDYTGPDTHAYDWALHHDIHGVKLQARWTKEGPQAGPNRNTRLVRRTLAEMELQAKPATCLAVWDGESKGTYDALTKALFASIPAEVWLVKDAQSRLLAHDEVEQQLRAAAKIIAQRRATQKAHDNTKRA